MDEEVEEDDGDDEDVEDEEDDDEDDYDRKGKKRRKIGASAFIDAEAGHYTVQVWLPILIVR